MSDSAQLIGTYRGQNRVREGREAELSPQDRKLLQKSGPDMDLELRPDGKFKKQVTEGSWRLDGSVVLFTPEKFGGKTHEEMIRNAEEQGRVFGLGFVFNPFELLVQGDTLVSSDESTLIYIEYVKRK